MRRLIVRLLLAQLRRAGAGPTFYEGKPGEQHVPQKPVHGK